jgi:Late competence development protein ComFB
VATILVNLTLLKVNEEVENFLASYPNLVDKNKLKDPTFRPNLIAYVLSRVPNRYVTIESQKESSIFPELTTYSTQEQLEIEKQIYQGVFYLTKKEQNSKFDYTYSKSYHN